MLRRTFAVLLTALAPSVAFASSDDAWEEMRADVSAKCAQAAASSIEAPKTIVDPYGSDNFSLALVYGKPKGAEGRIVQICVYDKQTQAVELGSELTGDELRGIAD